MKNAPVFLKTVGGIYILSDSKLKQTQNFWFGQASRNIFNSRDLAFNKVLIHIIISNYAIFTAATFLLAELSHAASLELKNSYLEIRCLVVRKVVQLQVRTKIQQTKIAVTKI